MENPEGHPSDFMETRASQEKSKEHSGTAEPSWGLLVWDPGAFLGLPGVHTGASRAFQGLLGLSAEPSTGDASPSPITEFSGFRQTGRTRRTSLGLPGWAPKPLVSV